MSPPPPSSLSILSCDPVDCTLLDAAAGTRPDLDPDRGTAPPTTGADPLAPPWAAVIWATRPMALGSDNRSSPFCSRRDSCATRSHSTWIASSHNKSVSSSGAQQTKLRFAVTIRRQYCLCFDTGSVCNASMMLESGMIPRGWYSYKLKINNIKEQLVNGPDGNSNNIYKG